MRNAIHKIQNPELPLRSRMFQLLSTIAMAEFIIVSVYTVVTGVGVVISIGFPMWPISSVGVGVEKPVTMGDLMT